MTDYVKNPHFTVYQPFYIHNVLLSMYSGIFQWFLNDYFTEFKFTTMATHNKAQEEIEQFRQQGDNPDKIYLPAISFNPIGTMEVEENFANIWRNSQLGTPFAQKLLSNQPEYKDDYFEFYIIYEKLHGTFEMILWLASMSEYLDHKKMLIDWFHGGFNRRVRIDSIPTEVIIPCELVDTAYQDSPYDWSNTELKTKLIKTLNQNAYIYPIYLNPQIWLEGISDASELYGQDNLAEYKINVSMHWNCMIPSYFIIKSNLRPKYLRVSFDFNPVVLNNMNRYEVHEYDDDFLRIVPKESILSQYPSKNQYPIDTDIFRFHKRKNILSKEEYIPGSTTGPFPAGRINFPAIYLPYMIPYLNKLVLTSQMGNFSLTYDYLLKYTCTGQEKDGTLLDISELNITDYNQIIIGNGRYVLEEGYEWFLVKDENEEKYNYIQFTSSFYGSEGDVLDILIYKKEGGQ